MKYTFLLTEAEIQQAIRELVRPNIPHFAQPEDLEITLEDSQGRTIIVKDVSVEYEHPKERLEE